MSKKNSKGIGKLKRIVAKAKQLRRANPSKKKKWSSYIKEASASLNKKKPAKRKAKAQKKAAPKPRVRAVKKKKPVYIITHRVRRVGNAGAAKKSVLPWLLLGGAALWWISSRNKPNPGPPAQTYTPLRYTGNPQRDSVADQIVKYATAAGYAANTILNLIERLNNATNSQVNDLKNYIDTTNQLPGEWV